MMFDSRTLKVEPHSNPLIYISTIKSSSKGVFGCSFSCMSSDIFRQPWFLYLGKIRTEQQIKEGKSTIRTARKSVVVV
jgi:hypothetical protein